MRLWVRTGAGKGGGDGQGDDFEDQFVTCCVLTVATSVSSCFPQDRLWDWGDLIFDP